MPPESEKRKWDEKDKESILVYFDIVVVRTSL